MFFGFGKITITAQADEVIKTVTGTQLFIFTMVNT
jgi:hypothetical protein